MADYFPLRPGFNHMSLLSKGFRCCTVYEFQFSNVVYALLRVSCFANASASWTLAEKADLFTQFCWICNSIRTLTVVIMCFPQDEVLSCVETTLNDINFSAEVTGSHMRPVVVLEKLDLTR